MSRKEFTICSGSVGPKKALVAKKIASCLTGTWIKGTEFLFE